MTTEENYLCRTSSEDISQGTNTFIAVSTASVARGADVISSLSSSPVDNYVVSEGGIVYFLRLTQGEYQSISERDDIIQHIQPIIKQVKVSPLAENAPQGSRLRLEAGATDRGDEILSAASSLVAGVCPSCVTYMDLSPSGTDILVSGSPDVPALSKLLAASAVSDELFAITADPPHEAFNKDATWIVQAGNKTTHTPFFDRGITGSGITVGVADSGLDHQSCFFYDSSRRVTFPSQGDSITGRPVYEDTSHRKVVQYVGFADSTEGEDGGHGTHVVGSILGQSAGQTHNGMAPDGRVAFYHIGLPNAQYLNVPGNLATQMFPYAKRVGAAIHSNSWGSNTNSYTSDARQVDSYSFENQDFLVLVAAGNSGGDGSSQFPGSLGAPATAKNCVSVGATSNGNEDNDIAYFSSRGPAFDGRIKPDVVAPGFFIMSARSSPSPTDGHCDDVQMAGTSMATPVTAGAAALAQQYFEDGWYPSGKRVKEDGFKPMGALLKAVLINGAQRLNGNMANFQARRWPNNDQGHGIVELDATLNFADAFPGQGLFVRGDFGSMPQFASASDPAAEHTFKSTGSGCVPSGSDTEFRATLVWHDAPASQGSSRSLVNDLDVVVTGSDGSVHYPNGGAGRDSVNNAESVAFVPAEGVEYTVSVSADAIQTGPQPYALVVSGCFASPDRPVETGPGGILGSFDPMVIAYVAGGIAGVALLAGMALLGGRLASSIGSRPKAKPYAAKRTSKYGGRRSTSASRGSSFSKATGYTGGGGYGGTVKSQMHKPQVSIGLTKPKRPSTTKYHGKVTKTFNDAKWGNMV